MPTGRQVKDYFHELAFSETYPLPDGIKGAINGILAKAAGGNENRKLVLKYLTGVTSSKKLTNGQWHALHCLVRPYRDEALGWVADNPKFRAALNAILAYMANQEGQMEMEPGLGLKY